jgi:hypothetical protein
MSSGRAGSRFQACGSCKQNWATCESFLVDPGVRLLGLQPVMSNTDFNVLVFEHRCGSSISILAPRLRHLLPPADPDAPATRLMGTEQCRGHCRFLHDLAACDAPCSSARDRQLILLVQRMEQMAEALARGQ